LDKRVINIFEVEFYPFGIIENGNSRWVKSGSFHSGCFGPTTPDEARAPIGLVPLP